MIYLKIRKKIKRIFARLSLFFKTNKFKRKEYFLSVLAPVKDEEHYLIEFVNYYLLQGVDHFYFYDNESQAPLAEVLHDYPDVCTIIPFAGEAIQYPCYAHFCQNFKHETEWIAIFDIDEFVLPLKHSNLRTFLKDYERFDGVGINWVMFGDGFHKTRPEGNVIENYLYREAEQHPCIKSVVKTDRIVAIEHSHYATLQFGAKYVDAKFNKITGAYNENRTTDIIQLNHYFTKSAAEYIKKINRKGVDTGKPRVDRVADRDWVFDCNEKFNVIRETLIVDKYGKALNEKITSRHARVEPSAHCKNER